MEKVYRVNGHVIQFVDEMCGDSWKKKGYHGPVICNYADGSEYQGEWQVQRFVLSSHFRHSTAILTHC